MPDQSGDQPVVARNRSASGGVNTFSFPLDINDDQAVDLTNMIASVPGKRGTRAGTSVIASGITYGPILAMSEFTPSSYSSELLAISPGATFPNAAHLQLWKWTGVGNWSHVGPLSGMTSATLPVDIVTGLDLNAAGGPAVARIFTKQPIDHNWYYAGGGITHATGANGMPTTGMFPLGGALGRMFGAGRAAGSRGKLFYSDVASFANVTGWVSTQSFTMGGGTKQEIVAIRQFRQAELMVFMQDRIEALILDGDPFGVTSGAMSASAWTRLVYDQTIGCGSRKSIATVGEDLFFADQYGSIRSLARTITDNAQGTKSLPVSAAIQSWIDRVNPAAIDSIQAAAYDRYYVVSLPIDSATTPSHTFAFDVINKAWYGPWTGTWSKVGCMAVAALNGSTANSDKNPTLYVGGASTGNGIVYRTFSGTADDSDPIVMQETTKRNSFGTLEATKAPRRLRVYALPSPGATMMVEARKDGADWKLVGYMDLSGSAGQLPTTLPIDLTGAGIVEKVMTLEQNFQKARDLQYRFTCTANADVQILGYSTQVHMHNINWQVN